MRCARVGGFVTALVLAGCVRSCDCGDKPGTKPAPSNATAGQGAGKPQPVAGGGTTPASAASGPGRTLDRVAYSPAPDSKLTRSLIAARDEIDKGKVYDELSEPTSIAAVLGDKLGIMRAEGAVSAAGREGSGTEVAVAARNYVAGKQRVRVKIIDTALSPAARRAVSERLAQIGNEAAGNQRGVFVRGQPAVVAHFADQRASRASALIANRYLVQVMVNEAAQPDAAIKVIEQLDWGKLAPKGTKAQKP
jgi:hypothetical protein